MLKENGREKPIDKSEYSNIKGKKFKCEKCNVIFSKTNVEFGEEIRCPFCDGVIEEIV